MNFTPQEQRHAQDEVERIMNDPERKIGEGGIGEVFHTSKGLCVKVMKPTPDRTGERNLVGREATFQLRLAQLNVEDVRVPRCYGYWQAENEDERHGIIMEQLDAVNLQFIVNGTEEAPDGFDPEECIDLLEEFLSEVHELGILHNDIWPRNVMIDRKTGKPYLIDFGNAKDVSALPETQSERLKNQELHFLEARFRKPLQTLTT